MNKVILVGRLVAEPEPKNFNDGTEYCNFKLAVDRDYKDKDGNRPCDFIKCKVTRARAKFLAAYFHKGDGVGIQGSWRVDVSGDGDDRKYFEYCDVDNIEFLPGKKGAAAPEPDLKAGELTEIPDQGELPF